MSHFCGVTNPYHLEISLREGYVPVEAFNHALPYVQGRQEPGHQPYGFPPIRSQGFTADYVRMDFRDGSSVRIAHEGKLYLTKPLFGVRAALPLP